MEMTLSGLKAALPAEAPLWVMGHEAPDADTAVSALGEAWLRLALGEAALPVLRCGRMPREIALLLGEAAAVYPLVTEAEIDAHLAAPGAGLILTDHHDIPPHRRAYIRGIVDHHPAEADASLPDVPVLLSPAGAATSLVALAWKRAGLIPDKTVAGILLGAILMDTECLSEAKTRAEDRAAADWLLPLWGGDIRTWFFTLQEALLSETDEEILFNRDLRCFPHGDFAILKVKWDAPLQTASLKQRLAERRASSGKPMALMKIVRYFPDGSREEDYTVAGCPRTVERVKALLSAMGGEDAAEKPDGVILPRGGNHISRKKLAPRLEEIF